MVHLFSLVFRPSAYARASNPSILKGKAKEKLPRLAQAGPAEAMNAHRCSPRGVRNEGGGGKGFSINFSRLHARVR